MLGKPKGSKLFNTWAELEDFVDNMDNYTFQPFFSSFKGFEGEGFYGNVVQGFILRVLSDNILIFGVAIDGTLVFRRRDYPDTSSWRDPKILLRST